MLAIGEISEKVPVVSLTTKSSEVNLLFEEDPDLEGILVIEGETPVGLVMKGQFYQKISAKYGFDLFMGRPIHLVMDDSPLIVDYFETVISVSSLAMARSQKNLYDYVIVTKNNQLVGIVSIKNLLIKLAEVQVNQAMFSNPLSGLPGNVLIDEKIIEYLNSENSPFSLLYLDLDHFKEYNDTYGFNKGDLLLKEVANLLREHALFDQYGGSFVGHIGGDDFVAILPHYQYEGICKSLINDFQKRIRQYYDESDWDNQYVYTKGRDGKHGNIPLVSLSIAVLTNEYLVFQSLDEVSKLVAEVKKQCKAYHYSCFISYQGTNIISNQ
ncbi:GGDEF domain-containing protein [Bacillus sp. AK128]